MIKTGGGPLARRQLVHRRATRAPLGRGRAPLRVRAADAPPAPVADPATTSATSPLDASRSWYAFTVATAAATLVLTPLHVAFGDVASFYNAPLADPDAWTEAALAAVWSVEAWQSWRAKSAPLGAVDGAADGDASPSPSAAAAAADTNVGAAAAAPLLVDIAAIIPFDAIAAACVHAADGALPAWVPLLRLTALLRVHRLKGAFRSLEYDTSLSLLAVTIARNVTLVASAAHVAACALYCFASRGVDAALLPGVDTDLLAAANGDGARYLICLFWALTTLTSGGEYGNAVPDTLAATGAATARAGLFLAFEITLLSYILGSTTMHLVAGDERASRFRSKSAQLRGFAARARVPPDLAAAMDDHLRLHFATEEAEASDDAVLAIYPTALRRRVLRHVYGGTLRDAYLFSGTPRRFRDAVLAGSRLEQFLPGVDILEEGDAVNEVYVLVDGRVTVRVSAALTTSTQASLDDDGGASTGPTQATTTLGPGSIFGDLAFFTEEPQASVVTSATPVRVLTIPRPTLDATLRSFPRAARRVLANLLDEAERLVAREFSLPPGGAAAAFGDGAAPASATRAQRAALADLARVRAAVAALAARAERERTTRLLYAAAAGDGRAVRAALADGVDANSADFDGRTALMLAAGCGDVPTVTALLAAGADPCASDVFGGSAWSEAADNGSDAVIAALLATSATMADVRPPPSATARCPVSMSARLCSIVHAHDAPRLKRYIAAGAPLDDGDWDDRRAAHIAAADGSLTLVRALVEAGADVSVRDRWGYTPLDEAVRVGAGPVVQYLESVGAKRGAPAVVTNGS